jgi:uncharacterized protein (TIGR03435 family)
MERKMLQERFGLKVHRETREMSAVVLTTAKGGPKMASSVMVDPGVTFSMHPAAGGGGVRVYGTEFVNGRLQAGAAEFSGPAGSG